MVRLGWKLSYGEDNLVKECIISKYIQTKEVVPFKHGSKIRKSIRFGWNLLNDNKIWPIVDGKDISFWDDNWLGIGTFRSLILGPFLNQEQNLKISDLWVDNSWHLHKLSFVLPDFVSSRISVTSIPSLAGNPCNHLISSFVENNKLSLFRAYSTLTSHRKPEQIWIGYGKAP